MSYSVKDATVATICPSGIELSIRVVQMLMAFSFHTYHMYTIGSFEEFDLAHHCFLLESFT